MRIRVAGILIKDSKILMIHRFRDGEEYWVLPGGGVEEGEKPEEAVLREIKEETSIDAKLKSEAVVFKDSHTLQGETSEHQVFECEYISGDPKLSDNSIEVSKTNENNTYEPMWVNIEQVKDLNIKPMKTREFLASFKT